MEVVLYVFDGLELTTGAQLGEGSNPPHINHPPSFKKGYTTKTINTM